MESTFESKGTISNIFSFPGFDRWVLGVWDYSAAVLTILFGAANVLYGVWFWDDYNVLNIVFFLFRY